jgi:hypothetical protein
VQRTFRARYWRNEPDRETSRQVAR